ncbi:MAG: hypothetical protein EHM48_04835 [Planctomycetaceae bacterium]|nr:MAG: hypothetical protein EHM48_04835 [Planctomycetaceae bacterium]
MADVFLLGLSCTHQNSSAHESIACLLLTIQTEKDRIGVVACHIRFGPRHGCHYLPSGHNRSGKKRLEQSYASAWIIADRVVVHWTGNSY